MKTIIQKTKSLLIFHLFFISFSNSYGQSITTGTVSPYLVCLGNTIVVPFVTTGNFNQNDFFRVQLSNTTGNFNSTSATIGSLEITSPISGTFSGSITATIPTTISASTQYRVRVVYVVSGATSPAVIGSRNTSNLIQVLHCQHQSAREQLRPYQQLLITMSQVLGHPHLTISLQQILLLIIHSHQRQDFVQML